MCYIGVLAQGMISTNKNYAQIDTMNLEAKILRSDELVEANIDDDKVMMSVESGLYFGLDAVASRVWELLETPLNVSELVDILTKEFDVDSTQCLEDIEPFINMLHEHKLISFAE